VSVRPGDVIAGKFRIERVLGEGGMGFVVAARHLHLGQTVALKFMRDEVCSPDYKSRFLREARNTVRLKSKHVSRVLDVGTLESGAPYMVMEYLEGKDLSNLLHEQGPIAVHEACEYVLQACEAIAEAHSHGIVHRDLKPANLFLTRGPSGEAIVKVLDFGVSKVLDLGMEDDTSPGGRPRPSRADSVVTKATDLLGSPSYMSPEQIASARDADARSDIWSLGVILFRLITGHAPFAAGSIGQLIQSIVHGTPPSLRDVKPDVPYGLEDVVARCLQRDRARRPDAVELARMLSPYAAPSPAPSVERIAILGPALVTPRAPQPSVPSFRSSGGAWSSGSHSPSRPRRTSTAAIVAIVVASIAVVGGGALALAHQLAASVVRSSEPATAASPPVAPEPLPLPPAVIALPEPPAASREEEGAMDPPKTAHRRGGAHEKPHPTGHGSAKGPEPAAPLEPGEIPSTRE
jgi:eukaryotic-like serine/threonine-protein kinase